VASNGPARRHTVGVAGRDVARIELHDYTKKVTQGIDMATVSDAIEQGPRCFLSTSTTDEYGNPTNPATAGATRYGWLGTKQRAADTPAGLVLMGVRLYNALTGRFLQVDPIYGGNANDYDYCNASPVGCVDLNGKWPNWHKVGRWWDRHGGGITNALAIAGFAACTMATAGLCVAVTAVGIAASLATSAGSYSQHHCTLRHAVVGSVFDVGSAFIPGARMTRAVRVTRSVRRVRYIRGWGITRIKWRAVKSVKRSMTWKDSYYEHTAKHVRHIGYQFGYTMFGFWRGKHNY
jgi:RHS repeat-associated protein